MLILRKASMLFLLLESARSAICSLAIQDGERVQRAQELLRKYPLIDAHVDLPQVMRVLARRPLDEIPKLSTAYPGHVDIPKLRTGGVGGLFLTAWTPCLDYSDTGKEFLSPTDTVRDALESIDLIHETVVQTPGLVLCHTAQEIEDAFEKREMAVMIGMEGSHMLGNSLSTLRLYTRLGVRYLTLTHVCHTAFASSNGGGAGTDGSSLASIHPGNGLTDLGRELVAEMNRLGVMVDLSHTTDATAHGAINISQAPVIFSHSGARAVYNHPRNVPDDILKRIGDRPDQNTGIVLSVLYPLFIDPKNATIARTVDHVEHIAKTCGKNHVGLASDFDGMGSSVIGMEDASKWPDMIAEFIKRGWTDEEMKGVMGGNLLRVMRDVEAAAAQLQCRKASPAIYDARTDIPGSTWGGPNGAYLPPDVKSVVDRRRIRDEL